MPENAEPANGADAERDNAAVSTVPDLTAHLVADHKLPLSAVESWGPIGLSYCHRLEHQVLKQDHSHPQHGVRQFCPNAPEHRRFCRCDEP